MPRCVSSNLRLHVLGAAHILWSAHGKLYVWLRPTSTQRVYALTRRVPAGLEVPTWSTDHAHHVCAAPPYPTAVALRGAAVWSGL